MLDETEKDMVDLTTLTKEKIEEVRKAMAIVESITQAKDWAKWWSIVTSEDGPSDGLDHQESWFKMSFGSNTDETLPSLDETFVTDFWIL